MSVCIAGGGALTKLAVAAFTLMWTHTIEKTRWEEDWRVTGGHLVIVEARVEGSGAGMEPPADAVLAGGMYRWHPQLPPLTALTLRRAPEAGDWKICAGGSCRTLAALLGRDADPVQISGCP